MNKYRLLWSWFPNSIYSLNFTELHWFSYYRGQAGRIEFDCLWGDSYSNHPDFHPGQMVSLWEDDKAIFRGYIFDVVFQQGKYKVICYDQLRYLLNKDSRIYYKQKASDVVKNIVASCGLVAGSMADINYTVPMLTFDGLTYFDMINKTLSEAEKYIGKRYVLFDKHGSVTLIALQNTTLNLRLDGGNAIIDAGRNLSIDKDFCSEVKLVQCSVDNPKYRSCYVYDQEAKNKYGAIRYFERADIDYTPEQMQNTAKYILSAHKKPVEKIDITALGNTACLGGYRPYISLPKIGIEGYYLINKAEHIISGNHGHIMKLQCTK